MPAYVMKPTIALPSHKITTAEICDDIRAHYPNHPRLPVWLRFVANTGVEARYWTRPLPEAAALAGVAVRGRLAFDDALEMAITSATGALTAAGLAPGDVDAIITSHTTSWTVPSLDIHLTNRLRLRPDVSRYPMATVACAAGAQGLIRAAQHVRAHPGSRVLVVVSETLSTIYHRSETSPQSMIYRTLFGDGSGACIVSSDPLGPGLRIDDTFEQVLPDSLDRYWGSIDGEGLHFDSTKAAARAARDALPPLQQWLGGRRPDWTVIHPGGPRIIEDVAEGLGLDARKTGRHSYASLAENGNLGGSAVLDVLRRTHDDPPAAGTCGLLTSFGPGFVTAAVRGTWVQ